LPATPSFLAIDWGAADKVAGNPDTTHNYSSFGAEPFWKIYSIVF
jgi:hypothetical protein